MPILIAQLPSPPVWAFLPINAILVGSLGYMYGEVLMFHLQKSSYNAVVNEVSAGRCSMSQRTAWHVQVDLVNCGSPVIVVIPWGGFCPFWHGVAFDESDEIAKPPEQRSAAWQATETGHALQHSGVKRGIGEHYYLAGAY